MVRADLHMIFNIDVTLYFGAERLRHTAQADKNALKRYFTLKNFFWPAAPKAFQLF
jgi:hypothetical protein